jgi:hypothetical protein
MSFPRRTQAQIQASRTNGRRSRGPVTFTGKDRSRANALTHGFSSTCVFPGEMKQEIEAQIAILEKKHHPRNPDEDRLVQLAAIAVVRAVHVARAEIVHTQHRVMTARDRYDTERRQRLQMLLDDFFTTNTPKLPLLELQQLSEGCDQLAAEWNALLQPIDNPGLEYEPDDLAHARRLLGLTNSTPASVTPYAEFLTDFERLTHSPPPPVLSPLPPGEGQGEGSSGDTAHGELDGMIDRVRAFLTTQRDHYQSAANERWTLIDEPLRNAAPERALIDLSNEGARFLRYLSTAQRLYDRSHAALKSLEHDNPTVSRPATTQSEPDSSPTPPQSPPPPPSETPETPHSQNEPRRPQPYEHAEVASGIEPPPTALPPLKPMFQSSAPSSLSAQPPPGPFPHPKK